MSTPLRPSTPIKKGFPPVETRRAVDAYKDLRDQNLLQDVNGTTFLETYLSNPTNTQWPTDEEGLVSRIKKVGSKQEESLYTGDAPLLCLLNSISKRIFDSSGSIGGAALVFRSGHECNIQNPFNRQLRSPDVVSSWEPTQEFPTIDHSTDRPPHTTWCTPVAVGEVKVKKQGQYQLASYLQHHLQFHPELNAVLGFTARPSGYALYYHDAAVIHQAKFSWKQATPLYAFVQKLYTRPFQDTSMQVVDPERPAWATQIGNDVYLSETPRALAGPGQRRYTTAAVNRTSNEEVFIKDIWRDERRKFFEASLLAQAHKERPLSGLMWPHSHGYVLDETGERISTTHLNPGSIGTQADRRYKMRMMTRDIGRPLKEVRSLRRFLCVMYDACAVQRNLYRKCQILHRDISDENIMLAPETDEYLARCEKGYADVKFINQVLAEARKEDGKPDPKPACLVIDLGNGADLKIPRGGDILTERTGTLKFIARSVPSQVVLAKEDYGSSGVNMPPLGDYGQYMHTRPYQDTDNLRSTIHSDVEFSHQLFHDAESTFWVILWTLAQSVAAANKKEPGPDLIFRRFYHTMQNYFLVPGDEDPRTNCKKAPGYWKSILHPDLECMVPMLTEMFMYIQPEWARLPQLDPEHAHEALMRLLLAEIVRIDENNEDIPLFVGARPIPRPPPGVQTNMVSLSLNPTISVPRQNSLGPPRNKPAKTRRDGTESPEKPADSQPQTPGNSQPLQQRESGSNVTAEGALEESVARVQLKARGELLRWQRRTCELQPPGGQTS
ncbi:hypothetical protein FRC11_004246, partial [Ceratobasidium sp. 423]